MAALGRQPPAGIRFTLHERFVRVTRVLAQDSRARLILGLNLEAGSRQLMAAEAAALRGVGRSALSAFELGNEPELYGAVSWYIKRGRKFMAAPTVTDSAPTTASSRASPRCSPPTCPWRGRSPAVHASSPRRQTFCAASRVWAWSPCICIRCVAALSARARPPIPASLTFSPPAHLPVWRRRSRHLSRSPHAHGATLRIAEMNSVSCGGAPGAQRPLRVRPVGTGRVVPPGPGGRRRRQLPYLHAGHLPAFSFEHVGGRWTATVKPEYYGLYTFAHVAPAGSKLLKVSAPSDERLRVWATGARDGRERVLLINTSAGSSRTVALRLGAARGRRASVEILTAPSLGSPHGIRLGGQFFARNTTTGALTGDRVVAHPRELRGGVCRVRVPAGSAAILTR